MVPANDYQLLRNVLGRHCPSLEALQYFCQHNPGYTWENYPIDSDIFPRHPDFDAIHCNNDFTLARINSLLMAQRPDSQMEYSFFFMGEYQNNRDGRFSLYYTHGFANSGGAYCSNFSPANEQLIQACNQHPHVAILLGHTHPRHGVHYMKLSIGDILYYVRYINSMRNQNPNQEAHKIVFTLAFPCSNERIGFRTFVYDPNKQERGGSAIFRLF